MKSNWKQPREVIQVSENEPKEQANAAKSAHGKMLKSNPLNYVHVSRAKP